jgi:hypothetical protein
MGYVSPKDQYERKMLEMLIRRRLPDNCDVRIEVETGGKSAAASFSLRDSQISVDSDISSLDLNRIIVPSPPNW